MPNYLSLGEFIAECETFPYSREHYEILREAYEIDLGWHYIESMEFQASSEYYMYESMMDGYPSEYFYEYEEYMSEADDNEAKEKGFFGKIGKFFRDIGDKFIRFITNIGNKCSSIEVLKNEASNGTWYKHRWTYQQILGIGKYLKVDFKKWTEFELVGEQANNAKELRFDGDVPEEIQSGFTKFLNAMLMEGIEVKDEDIETLTEKIKEGTKEKIAHHPVGYIATAVGAPILVNKAWSLASDFLVKKFNDWRVNDYGDQGLKEANQELAWFYQALRASAETQKSNGTMDAEAFEAMMIKISNYEKNHSGKNPTSSAEIIEIFRTLTESEPSDKVKDILEKVDARRAELKQQKDEQNANEQNKAKRVVNAAGSTVKNAMSGSVGNTIATIATDYKKEIGAVLSFSAGCLMIKRWKAATRKKINEFVQGKFDNSQEESE